MFQKLHNEWTNGNRNFVVSELLKMPRSMVARFMMLIIQHYKWDEYNVATLLSMIENKCTELEFYGE